MSISSISGNAVNSLVTPAVILRKNTPDVPLELPPVKDVQPSRQELEEATKTVTDFVKSFNNSLQFSIDDSTGRTVVKVIDSVTKEVIRQIPSEEMQVIAKALDSIKGLLIQQKA